MCCVLLVVVFVYCHVFFFLCLDTSPRVVIVLGHVCLIPFRRCHRFIISIISRINVVLFVYVRVCYVDVCVSSYVYYCLSASCFYVILSFVVFLFVCVARMCRVLCVIRICVVIILCIVLFLLWCCFRITMCFSCLRFISCFIIFRFMYRINCGSPIFIYMCIVMVVMFLLLMFVPCPYPSIVWS